MILYDIMIIPPKKMSNYNHRTSAALKVWSASFFVCETGASPLWVFGC